MPALVGVVMVLLLGIDLWSDHRKTIVDAEAAAVVEARAGAAHAGRTVDALVNLLHLVAPDADRAPRRHGDVGAALLRLSPALRPAVGLYAVDDRGRISASWDSDRPTGVDAPEPALDAARRPADGAVSVSVPFRRDGVWVVALVRRMMDTASGRSGGFAVAELQLDYLSRAYEAMPGTVAGGNPALYRADGTPLVEGGAEALPLRSLEPGREGGILAHATAEDSIVAWCRVAGHPLIAVVVLPRWEVLADWRAGLLRHAAGFLLAAVALGFVVVLPLRRLKAIRRSNDRLRAAVDASMDAFFVLAAERDASGDIVDFRFIDTNPNGEAALGLARSGIVGELLSRIAPRGHFETMRETYAVVVESGHPVEEELVVEGVHGPEWMQHQIVRLDDGVAITSRNISERRRAEEKAIAAEMRVAEIAASLPGAVLQYRREADGTFRFTYVSQSISRLCGLSPEDLENDSTALLRLALPEDKAAFQKAIAVSARRLAPLRLDYRSRSPDGVRWLRIDALPKRRGDGAVAWSGLLTDVTAEKHAEAELEAAKLEAEEANHTKSAFLANMSHELRTPLNAIIGFSDGLGTGMFGPMTGKQREYVEDIRSAGTHLLLIINDLLDLSKIEAGKARLHDEPVVIGEVVDAAMALLRGHAVDKGLALEADLAHDLPTIMADEVKLKQILVNLLSNAVKFTPAGGTVALAAMRGEDGGVTLQVRDTGHGIAPADLDNVLEPFWQVEGAHVRKAGGTGLGLSLVKHLTAMHGGTMDIRSTLGRGTVVTVALPASRVIPANSRRRSSAGPGVRARV